jgi:nitrate reductase assembly molybdenum cofactor insertion protein NarJ
MGPDHCVFDDLAALLRPPDAHFREHLASARVALGGVPPAVQLLDQFAARLEALALEDLQELFTETFSTDPPCAIELAPERLADLLVQLDRPADRCTVRKDNVPSLVSTLARMATAFEDRRNPYGLVLRIVCWLLAGRFAVEIPLDARMTGVIGESPAPSYKAFEGKASRGEDS